MNWGSAILGGLAATVIQTTIESAGRGLGLTRMGIPLLMGSMFTMNRDRATVIGLVMHLVNGALATLVYVLVFEQLGAATWWIGSLLGLGHGLFVLVVVMPIMPGFHPLMASERHGPEPTPMLEPPGFMAMNYGRMTPLVSLAAHLAFGVVLGLWYEVAA